jgi:biopolymer transport protein ExbB/TolQ
MQIEKDLFEILVAGFMIAALAACIVLLLVILSNIRRLRRLNERNREQAHQLGDLLVGKELHSRDFDDWLRRLRARHQRTQEEAVRSDRQRSTLRCSASHGYFPASQ